MIIAVVDVEDRNKKVESVDLILNSAFQSSGCLGDCKWQNQSLISD